MNITDMYLTSIDWHPLAVVGWFILGDILTGTLAALKKGELSSTVSREGGWHKVGEVFAIVLAYSLEWGMQYVDMGIEIPAVGFVLAYIIVCEIISIVENVCVLSPGLTGFLGQWFDKVSSDDKE